MKVNLSPKLQELMVRCKKFNDTQSDEMKLAFQNLFMATSLKVNNESFDCYKCAAAEYSIYFDEANKCYQLCVMSCNKKTSLNANLVTGLFPDVELFFCSGFTLNFESKKEGVK